jgi:hypothetical protein
MVCSTFYDLRQIRADLTAFSANELGNVPLLSELNEYLAARSKGIPVYTK